MEQLDVWLRSEKLDPDDPKLSEFLNRRAEGIRLVFRATSLPGCRFDISPDLTVQPEWSNYVRTAAAVADLYARHLAARGQITSAVECVRRGTKNRERSDPESISPPPGGPFQQDQGPMRAACTPEVK